MISKSKNADILKVEQSEIGKQVKLVERVLCCLYQMYFARKGNIPNGRPLPYFNFVYQDRLMYSDIFGPIIEECDDIIPKELSYSDGTQAKLRKLFPLISNDLILSESCKPGIATRWKIDRSKEGKNEVYLV